jgi:hypothetical protein
MSRLREWLGLKAPAALPREGPCGLLPGKLMDFDSSLGMLLADVSVVRVPTGERIHSEGTIELGAGNFLSRFYLADNDNWLQVHTTGSRDGRVESVILFNYLSCQPLNSQAELARLAGPQSPIGLPEYQRDGATYQRQWGTEAGQTELVPYEETVFAPGETYRISHHAMLYARELPLGERREFLLFAVEKDEEGAISLSTSLGVSLSTADFTSL